MNLRAFTEANDRFNLVETLKVEGYEYWGELSIWFEFISQKVIEESKINIFDFRKWAWKTAGVAAEARGLEEYSVQSIYKPADFLIPLYMKKIYIHEGGMPLYKLCCPLKAEYEMKSGDGILTVQAAILQPAEDPEDFAPFFPKRFTFGPQILQPGDLLRVQITLADELKGWD